MTETKTHLYSPGLVGVIATESSVSDINGEKGILSYRGYSIEELAQKSTFEETSYLLLFGELPNKSELESFTKKVTDDFLNMIKNKSKITLNSLSEDQVTTINSLSGVQEFPMRIKCATMAWHALLSAIEEKKN